MANTLIPFHGIVSTTNNQGFVLQGETAWRNYSQYGYHGGPKGNKPSPNQGDQVSGTVNEKGWLQTLIIGGQAQATAQAIPNAEYNPKPETAAPADVTVVTLPDSVSFTAVSKFDQDKLIEITRQTRLKLLGVMAVAKPDSFAPEAIDLLIETIRTLEDFVLEDFKAPDLDPEPDADDVLDEV